MVSLTAVKASNSLIATTLPPGLVAVFVGATSGIGETTLKQFAKYAIKPRAYFIGRSQDAGNRIATECKALNQEGEFIFIKADVSLIQVVDKVCAEISSKEKTLNILFLSAGVPSMNRSLTTENLHLLTAITCYSRFRFATNFLPLLQRASVLRRVVSVAGGGLEGPLDSSDFSALRVPLHKIRGHLCTLQSLGFEGVQKLAPEVSFVHDYPGAVDTTLATRMEGVVGVLIRAYMRYFGRWVCVPIEESGERHLYLATSSRYPPARGGTGHGFAVPTGDGIGLAPGSTGKSGSGVYSVGWDGEGPSPTVQKVLADYRSKGMVEEVWRHIESEFKRITE